MIVMPTSCPVCGSTDFDCESGLFFCSGCGTQSQQFVVEECERDYEVRATSVAGNKYESGKQEETSDEHEEQQCRPWAVTEGLTILLKHQVTALIKMGASPELKDVLFKLWASYLNKIGQGFGNTSQKASSSYFRSDFLPTFNQPNRTQVLLVNRQLKKKKQTHSVEDMQVMRQMFGGETFYDAEDDPFHQEKQDLDELDMYSEERECWLKQLRSEQKLNEVTYRGMQKYRGLIPVLHATLSLCYVALQYTNSFVTLFDILKAVKAGVLPYGDGAKLFPPDMKLIGKDWLYFCTPCTPSMALFYRTTKSICSLLGVLPLPAPDMKLFTLRYLHDMNLPVGLHGLIRALLMKREPRLSKPGSCFLPKTELLAMAYVIVATKLVFGLNDEMEKKTSKFTQELKRLLGSDSGIKLFDWLDWVVEDCRRRGLSSVLPNHWRDVRTSVDSDRYCRAFSKYCSLRSGKCRKYEQQNTKDITEVFKQMASQFESLRPHVENDEPPAVPSSECGSMQDLFGSVSSQNEFSRQNTGTQPQASEASLTDSSSDENHDYTHHSVMHLTDWDSFVDMVLSGSVTDHGRVQDPLFSSLPDEGAPSEILRLKLDEISKRLARPWTDYVFYKCRCDLKHCHKSYVYLLETAELFVGYEKDMLHSFVQLLELTYFGNEDRLLVSELNKRRSFISMYF